MNPLTTNPLKGMLDFPPSVMREYLYLKKIIDQTVMAMGFEEYSLPILESMDTFAVKSSDEILRDQSYFFQDRGGREVILRPEITPSLARLVSKEVATITPLRWFTVGPCYRYERPQKGRLREFLQLNCDILGDNEVTYDLEIFKVSLQLLNNFGITEDCIIQYNHRGFVDFLLEQMNFNNEEKSSFFQLIDRKNKMKSEEFLEKVSEIVSEDQLKIEFIDTYLTALSPATLIQKLVDAYPENFKQASLVKVEGFIELDQELQLLSPMLRYSPTVVRGFDYYTGVVFEVFGIKGDIKRSLFGGGRYDRLTSAYAKGKQKPLSGVGFGMGVYIFSLYLKSLDLLPEVITKKEGYYLAPLSKEVLPYTQALSKRFFIEKKINVVHAPNSIKKHLQIADKLGYTEVAIIGEDEMKKKVFQLKNLKTSEQQTIKANFYE